MSRPELTGPPEYYYNQQQANKYTSNSRVMEIQSKMSQRAVQLLNLSQPGLILDLGCGSGLSGQVLTQCGHAWVGIDISQAMLVKAKEIEAQGDLLLGDIGEGFGFRPGSFDGCISISAVQWLCNADKSSHNPFKRLCALFDSLYAALARGKRAVFQFYPSHPQQIEIITQAAVKSGFLADMIIDFPNSTKAKKYYLILYTGSSMNFVKNKGYQGDEQVTVSKKVKKHVKIKTNKKKSKNWIMQKKERQRMKGATVKRDSKYSGRKRKPYFQQY